MTGMVIGQENPLTMINANKLYEVQTHVNLTGHITQLIAGRLDAELWPDAKPRQVSEKVSHEVVPAGLPEFAMPVGHTRTGEAAVPPAAAHAEPNVEQRQVA